MHGGARGSANPRARARQLPAWPIHRRNDRRSESLRQHIREVRGLTFVAPDGVNAPVSAAAPKRQCGARQLPRNWSRDDIANHFVRNAQTLFAHRFAYQRAMAMLADTADVIIGSAHCGGKCDGCAKISPMNVATALIVACRLTLSVVRSI